MTLLFGQLLNVVPWCRVVANIQCAGKPVQAVSDRNIQRLAKDAVAGDHAQNLSDTSLFCFPMQQTNSRRDEKKKKKKKEEEKRGGKYRCSAYAMTCVFPPETYSTTGLSAPVISLPISISSSSRASACRRDVFPYVQRYTVER